MKPVRAILHRLGTKKRQESEERSHTWHANQASSLGRVFRASSLCKHSRREVLRIAARRIADESAACVGASKNTPMRLQEALQLSKKTSQYILVVYVKDGGRLEGEHPRLLDQFANRRNLWLQWQECLLR